MENIKERLVQISEINAQVNHIDAMMSALASDTNKYFEIHEYGQYTQASFDSGALFCLHKPLFNRLRDALDQILREEKNALLKEAEKLIVADVNVKA